MTDPIRTAPDAAGERRGRAGSRIVRWFARFPQWLRTVVAVASIVLGAVLVWRPVASLGVLALLFGAALVLTGALELAGVGDDGRRPRWRTLVGLLWIVTGVFVVFWLGLTVRVLVLMVGIGLVVNGILSVLSGFRRRGQTLDARVATVLLGAAGVVFGILALLWPDVTLLIVAVVFGARLIVSGAVGLRQAVRTPRGAAAAAAAEAGPADADPARPPVWRRWTRTIAAVVALVLALAGGVVSASLRGGAVSVDDFYATPRTVPDEPGRLIRAEPFTRAVPDGARAWRILYTTTDHAGEPSVASGIVVVPATGEGDWPVIDWAHGTTGFAQHCAPSLLPEPFESGALFVADEIVQRGWALVATDYIGLGTTGPHPYLIGVPSAHAVLDARRAASELSGARLGDRTVVWGHSQGGGAALWTGALADDYAPDLPLSGVVALAPASDPLALIDALTEVPGGSIFASFAVAAYTSIYDDVTFREYVRPGVEPIVRTLSRRCLSEPGVVVSILTSLGLSTDPEIFASDPTSGPLGTRLEQNAAPATVSAPLLIGQGGDDTLVRPGAQRAFVEGLCASGQRLEYAVYEGRGHIPLVERGSPAIADVFAWTAARFAGEPVDDGCRSLPQR